MLIYMAFILSFISVLLVSAISLIGLSIFFFSGKFISRIVFFLVSFSVGVLFGDVFIHIIPEVFEDLNATHASISILAGILGFFILEKFIHWHHSHKADEEDCLDHGDINHKALRSVVLVGDGLHNFLDGLIIAASYMVSLPLGIATTLAVIFHEIPQEIGDFGILVHSGLSKIRAVMFNLLSALSAVVGVFVAFILNGSVGEFSLIILAFAGGGFVYIAGSDLVPELHKTKNISASLVQLCAIVLGFLLMFGLTFLE